MVSKAGAESGRRAVEMLFAFEQRHVASVRQLAEQLSLPLPSAHRYVALLRDMGLVEEGLRGQYRLTMRVVALGRAARRGAPLVNIAEPFMEELSQKTGETVLLNRLVQDLPVCIHRIESQRQLRLSFEPGQSLPPLRGASARLLLGSLAPHVRETQVDRILASGARPPIGGREAFLQELSRHADRSWATSQDEIDEGVWSAAAVITEGGRTVATLSAPCPIIRLDAEKRATISDLVRVTAERISRALEPVPIPNNGDYQSLIRS
jgi:DNA-binding IclR family transcriptional regulator